MTAPVQVYNGTAGSGSGLTGGRRMAVLSDGTVVMLVQRGTTDLVVYHSQDRATFTLVATVSTTMYAGGRCAIAVEPTGDHLQVIFQANTGEGNIQWVRLTKGAGYTWTVGTVEVAVTETANTYVRFADIDTLGAGACAIIFHHHSTANGFESIYMQARGTGGAWGSQVAVYSHTYDTATVALSGYAVSCEADHFAAIAGDGSQVVAYAGKMKNTLDTRRMVVGTCRFVVATGALITGGNVAATGTYTSLSDFTDTVTQVRLFSVSAGNFYLAHTTGITSTGNTVTCEIIPYVWNGTTMVAGTTVSTTVPHYNTYGWRTPITYLPSAPGGAKMAFFPKESSGKMASVVYDFTTLAWSGPFAFTNTSINSNYAFSGATRNVTTKADVMFYDSAGYDYYFDFNQAPTAPTTGLSPVTGSTVTTDVPTLQVTLPALQTSSFMRRATFQMATDSAFTANVKTVTEPIADLNSTSVHSEATPSSSQLFQGTWYVRALTLDAFGQSSAYMSPSQSFLVSHPPTATNLSPSGSAPRTVGAIPFSWTFTDASPVDNQTAYQLIIERNDTGALVSDSGKVTSTTPSATITISGTYTDVLLRWKVRVWDSDDVTDVYSAYATFLPGTQPTVNVTAPVEGSSITTPVPTVTWTFTGFGSRTQANYQVVVTQAGATVHDSGVLQGAATSYAIPGSTLYNSLAYVVTVTVTDSGGFTGVDSNNFSTSWTAPTAPTFTIDSSVFSTAGYITLTWTNGQQDASYARYRIYRRPTGTTDWTKIYETTAVAASYSFQEWGLASGVSYSYAVVQVATRFGQEVESAYTFQSVLSTNEDYWLVHPTDNTKNVRLAIVTSDSFTDEYESQVLTLIGKGRKIDYGTRWGYTGSLTCQVYDTTLKTARQSRQDLEALQATKSEVYLRNPFGDIFLVDIGDAQIGRIAGVALREFHTLQFTYQELAP